MPFSATLAVSSVCQLLSPRQYWVVPPAVITSSLSARSAVSPLIFDSAIAAFALISESVMVPSTISAELTILIVAREPRPKFVRAAAASVAPVPPLVTGSVPVTSAEAKLIAPVLEAEVMRPCRSTVMVGRV